MQWLEWLRECKGFDWDEANRTKNWEKHRVARSEAEQAFFNRPLIVTDDIEHSEGEERFYALGQTDRRRGLFIVFTIRGGLLRVTSARDMTRREREVYRAHG